VSRSSAPSFPNPVALLHLAGAVLVGQHIEGRPRRAGSVTGVIYMSKLRAG